MALFTDTFDGAVDDLVSTRTGWTAIGNTAKDKARLNGSGGVKSIDVDDAGFQCLHVHDTGAADHWVEVVIGNATQGGNNSPRLIIVRAPASGYVDYYAVTYHQDYGLVGFNAVSTNLQNVSHSLPPGTVLRCEVEGTEARVYKNGTLILTQTGLGNTTNTRTGFVAQSATVQDAFITSFSTDELGAVDTVVPTLTGSITEVSKTENSISISWPAGSDDVAVTSYEVSTNGGSTWTDTGNTTTSRTFTGLTASTAYDIRVRAKDAAGNVSTPALATSITTLSPDTTVPVLTGAITVGAKSNGTISISWPTGTDNVAVAAYDVRVDGGSWVSQGTSTSTIVTGLTQLTSYTLEVTARDAAGNRSTPPLSVTTSTYRNGATGQFILDNTGPIGGNPAGILYNDVGVGDEDNWFSFVITTPPATGTLSINPDGTFTFTGPSAATMYYQLEVDGANVGAPQLVDLYETSGGGGDVTDPILSLPTGLATSSVTATGTVTTDEGAGVLYKIITTSPTALEAAVAAGSSQSVVSVGLQSVSFSGLTPLTTYYIHYLQEDPSGNRSLVVSSAGFLTPAAPVFNGAQDALNSIMVGKLRSLGFTGSLNDMLFAFYGGTGTLQDRERVWLIARTAVTGVSNKTMWAVYLRGLGYTGAFPDMLKAFWINY